MKNKKIKKKIHILALDQGTTSTRAILFDKYGNDVGFDQLAYVIDLLKNNPESRRIIINLC